MVNELISLTIDIVVSLILNVPYTCGFVPNLFYEVPWTVHHGTVVKKLALQTIASVVSFIINRCSTVVFLYQTELSTVYTFLSP